MSALPYWSSFYPIFAGLGQNDYWRNISVCKAVMSVGNDSVIAGAGVTRPMFVHSLAFSYFYHGSPALSTGNGTTTITTAVYSYYLDPIQLSFIDERVKNNH